MGRPGEGEGAGVGGAASHRRSGTVRYPPTRFELSAYLSSYAHRYICLRASGYLPTRIGQSVYAYRAICLRVPGYLPTRIGLSAYALQAIN
eukprot:928219-Rhodomonas_salina.2